MAKFKIGDKVVIRLDSRHDEFLSEAAGRKAVVVSDDGNEGYQWAGSPYVFLRFEGEPILSHNEWYFHEDGVDPIIPDPTPDAPVKPSHYYTAGMPQGVAVIDVIKAQGADFLHGNVIKYILRWKWKNGVEDLKKARTYLNWLIEQEEAKGSSPVHIPYLDN